MLFFSQSLQFYVQRKMNTRKNRFRDININILAMFYAALNRKIIVKMTFVKGLIKRNRESFRCFFFVIFILNCNLNILVLQKKNDLCYCTVLSNKSFCYFCFG